MAVPRIAGPCYLDSSAVVKLYLPEAESDTLNVALRGRRDVLISDLGVTEIVSALARRCREGFVGRDDVGRLHRTILDHCAFGYYLLLELTPKVHRDAERLLASGGIALRAADALHIALARSAAARSVVSYDASLSEAATAVGLDAFP